jgi:hypothetical protein
VPHGPDPRVLAVEDGPAARRGDLGDDRLDLGQLVQGVDPVQAEVVLGDVGDDGDVVAAHPHAFEEHPAPRGLEDADLDARRVEHTPRACGSGVVARLDDLTLHHHAVGRAPRCPQAGGHRDVRQHPGRRRLAVRPCDRRDGNARRAHERRVTVRGVQDRGRRRREHVLEAVAGEHGGEEAGQLLPRCPGPAPTAPDEGDHDLPEGLARPAPDTQSGGAGARCEEAEDPLGETRGKPLAGLGGRLTGASPPPQRSGAARQLVRRHGDDRRDVEDELDRRAAEVQVGTFEHPDLAGRYRVDGGGGAGAMADRMSELPA